MKFDIFGGQRRNKYEQFLFLQCHRFGLTSSGGCAPHYVFDKHYGMEEYVKFQDTVGCMSSEQANGSIVSAQTFKEAREKTWDEAARGAITTRARGARQWRQAGNNVHGRNVWCVSPDEPQAAALPLITAINRSLGVFSTSCLIEYGLRHAGGLLPSLLNDKGGVISFLHPNEIPAMLAGLVTYNTLELQWLTKVPIIYVGRYKRHAAERSLWKAFRTNATAGDRKAAFEALQELRADS